jgi:hypothetical protein
MFELAVGEHLLLASAKAKNRPKPEAVQIEKLTLERQ